ncbi:MAG: glycosyltransferase family 2 protein [Candidatus Brocadiaceae bacterium]|nr:glycosyltransferase family 2 protein [Candidatus Brocadiaceae bacterium]
MMDEATIIIPVYNEEDIIVANTKILLEHLQSFPGKFEIILSSNGSTDDTEELGILLAEQYPCVRFLSIKERGVGVAFKNAIATATYEKIVSFDMDLTVDMSFLERAMKLLDTYDIIIGSKIFGMQRRSFIRKFGSRVYVVVASTLCNLKFNDYAPSGKAYRKSVVANYLPYTDHGTSYVVETIFRASRDNRSIIQIPINCDDRRKSKFNLFHEGLYRYCHLFKLIFARYIHDGSAR